MVRNRRIRRTGLATMAGALGITGLLATAPMAGAAGKPGIAASQPAGSTDQVKASDEWYLHFRVFNLRVTNMEQTQNGPEITVEYDYFKDWPQTPLWGQLMISTATVDKNGNRRDWYWVSGTPVLSTNGQETEKDVTKAWWFNSSIKPGDKLYIKVEAEYGWDTDGRSSSSVEFIYNPKS
jgi:hypothetical protein